MRRFICGVAVALSLSCGGAGIQAAMQQTTDAMQPIVEQTRTICITARALARARSERDESVIVEACERLWRCWNDLAAIQTAIIEAADGE